MQQPPTHPPPLPLPTCCLFCSAQIPVFCHMQDPDWRARESGILALGAISDGCANGLLPFLEGMLAMLLPRLQDQRPLVRSITCWALSRYSRWLGQQSGQPGSGHAQVDAVLQVTSLRPACMLMLLRLFQPLHRLPKPAMWRQACRCCADMLPVPSSWKNCRRSKCIADVCLCQCKCDTSNNVQGILRCVVDHNKHVQEAACSALATMEEEAGPQLDPWLQVPPIAATDISKQVQRSCLSVRPYLTLTLYALDPVRTWTSL